MGAGWSAMRDPERADNVVASLASALGIESPRVLSAVFNRWSDLVGSDVASKCSPVSLRKGVLVVATESPGWAAQLRYLGPKVLAAVNDAAGATIAKRLEVSIRSPGRKAISSPANTPKTNDRLDEDATTSSRDVEEASRMVSEIEDPALAEATKKAYLAGKMHPRKGA